MLTVTNLSYSFPNKELYDDISFTVERGICCALIGSSGNGKSTLLDLMVNPDRYLYTGSVEYPTSPTIGFVKQFYEFDRTEERTVFQYLAQDFLDLEEAMEAHCVKMESGENLDLLLEQYQEMLDQFDAINGDGYESLIRKKLGLAGLSAHGDRSVFTLSGGEFKLVQVIRQMLTAPDLILMDEPDSFLDFEHLTALKDLMTQYQGTLLVVTHNRYLLNHCFQKVLHLENCKLLSFEGGYISYTYSLLETKIDCTELAEKDTEELARNEILIENLRDIAENSDSASNGRSLRARVSYQERLEARRTHNPFLNLQKPNFEFLSEGGVPDEIALTVRDFSLAFEETILDNVNFEIKFTDKVGVIGGNGTGKTSLLREIYKNSNQSITFHEGVTLSYLSQNHDEMFSSDQSIFDLFFDLGFPTYDTISDYLKGFCFPIEKMDQQISRLSGGEKNTLGLAVICHKKSNFLILDEPTSHLDTVGQIAFEAGLSRYQGGCLMISHDFYTLSNCMDYLLILEEKTVRKMQLRKFRKKTYANHFTHDYLALEQHKKQLETKIESALSYKNIELAREILLELEQVVKEMS